MPVEKEFTGTTSETRPNIPTPPEHLQLTDSNDRQQEIWPSFTCPACNSDTNHIRWETTSIPDDMKPHPQHYTGTQPCCYRCGSAANKHTRDKHRPEPWKQPILHVIHSIDGLSGNHPAATNIYTTYDNEPESFLTAPKSELGTISGIGDTWADKIHTNRAAIYPDHTPPVDGELYEFRGRRITDVSPQQIAHDLAIQYITVDELPCDSPNTTVQSHLADVATLIENGEINAGGFRTGTPHIDVEAVTEQLTGT